MKSGKMKQRYVMLLLLLCTVAYPAKLERKDFHGWKSIELSNEFVRINVTPELGGRILNYQLGDHPFLWANSNLEGQVPPSSHLAPDGSWLNWGGDKLWPAPQGWDNANQWPGPPDPVLDGSPQEAKVVSRNSNSVALRLTSPKDPRTGIQFSRVISIFNHSSRVHVVATMTNIADRPVRWGIWTVTQLDADSRIGEGWNPDFYTYAPVNRNSRFSNGYRVLFGDEKNPEFPLNPQEGLLKLHYQWVVGKVGLDSDAGWLANVDGFTGYLFVQSFDFVPGGSYPDDSSVEVWTNGIGTIHAWGREERMKENSRENPYIVESELVSPFADLTPGERSNFQYDWFSANIGGNYPVLACSKYGCICEQFKAERNGRLVHLNGRFGIFHDGKAAVEWSDSQGRALGGSQLLNRVSPLKPFLLENVPVQVPLNAKTAHLVLYGLKDQRIGQIAQAVILPWVTVAR